MPDELFGPVNSFRDAERGLIAHIDIWADTYLARRERYVGITPGTIKRPQSYLSKQSFSALPGEESTPAVIVVSDGFSEAPHRHGNGTWDVKLRMAVAVLCHGPEGPYARDLAGHYQTALTMLLLQKRKFLNVEFDDWVDLRMEDVDEDQQRTLSAVRIELVYVIRDFVQDSTAPPAAPDDPHVPPVDPLPPQPGPHTVQSTGVTTEDLP